MPPEQSSKSRNEVLADHEEVHALVEELEQQLADPKAGDGPDPTKLYAALSELQTRLAVHFEAEEAGGVHEQLKDEAPRLARQLDRLFADHPVIIKRLGRLVIDFSEAGSYPPERLQQLFGETIELLGHITEHEAAENRVMLDAYWNDVGGEAG